MKLITYRVVHKIYNIEWFLKLTYRVVYETHNIKSGALNSEYIEWFLKLIMYRVVLETHNI